MKLRRVCSDNGSRITTLSKSWTGRRYLQRLCFLSAFWPEHKVPNSSSFGSRSHTSIGLRRTICLEWLSTRVPWIFCSRLHIISTSNTALLLLLIIHLQFRTSIPYFLHSSANLVAISSCFILVLTIPSTPLVTSRWKCLPALVDAYKT
jgi:hypothetical protein